MKENIKFLVKIIEIYEEREGTYAIESDGDSKNKLWVIFGNREYEIDTKDTERLKKLWEEIEKHCF